MCTDCKGKTFIDIKARHSVYRPGKTARDKATGAHGARFINRAARIARDNEITRKSK